MKKIYLVLLVSILVSFVKAQTLVAYYPFNGNANDASGNKFNGVITGGVTSTSDRNGNANSAYSFDGSTGRIDVVDTPALRPANLTLSAWFYYSAIPSNFANIATKNLCNSYHESFALYIQGGSGKLYGTLSDGSGNTDLSGPTPSLNTWHMGTLTFDDAHDSAKLYLDGSLVVAVQTSRSIAYDNNSFAIGYELENCANNYFFNGKIDDIRLYNGVLSISQVTQLFDSTVQRPGSGTDVNFNGTSNFAAVPSSVLYNSNVFTIEFWIKTTENRFNNTFWQRPTMTGIELPGDGSNDFGITTDTGRLGMWSGLSSGDLGMLTNTKINDNKWHHIAAVNDGSNIVLYVDGVLQTGSLPSGKTLNTNARSFFIGASNSNTVGGAGYFHQGEYDEVRYWDKALTQQEIRDRMCHKITSSDSLYGYLVAYYKFDEANTTGSALDATKNYNNALLYNNPLRLNSGAPIGDKSVNDYINKTKTASITASSGETFSVTSISGKPNGLQLYVVNGKPDYTKGVNILCSKYKYFGVFQVGGKSPKYSAVYNYTKNSCVTSTNEDSLRLYQRINIAGRTWSLLPDTANTSSNTITLNEIKGAIAEYILGLDTTSTAIADANESLERIDNNETSVILSPNPASSILHINLLNQLKNNTYALILLKDINGKTVWSTTANSSANIDADVSKLSNGIYILQIINSDNAVITKKLIVSR